MVVSLSERLGITALAKRPVLRPAGTHDYFLRAARRAAQREGDIRHVDMIREAIDVDGRLVLARLTGSIHRTDAMLETCRLEAPPGRETTTDWRARTRGRGDNSHTPVVGRCASPANPGQGSAPTRLGASAEAPVFLGGIADLTRKGVLCHMTRARRP